MRARLAAALSSLLLAVVLPGSATAGAAMRFEDHHIGFFCEQSIDGGTAAIHIDVSNFGDFGGVEVWLGDALPFEDPPTLSGGTEDVTLTTLASGFELGASFTVFDAEGAVGEGSIEATLTPSGDLEIFSPDRFGNRVTKIEGSFQPMDVSGSANLPVVGVIELGPCGGDETFIKVLETNPNSFVLGNEGVVIDCFWATDDSAAGLFAISDSFGSFADAFLSTPDFELFATGDSTLDFTAESLSAVIGMFDPATGDPAEATADASLTPIGDPVTSVILSSTTREKVTEQRLSPAGELDFTTGQSYGIDDEACFARTFDSHLIDTNPTGPKAGGKTPVNDTPDGALPLRVGSHATTQTGGAAIEPELVPTTCPDGEFDKMGRTVWYTIEGTGGEVTVDTAGSNFDTVLAVYVLDGEDLVEIACVDDVFFDPIGLTFQAAISGPTEEGVTYYVQIGGFDARDGGGDVEFGTLRVAVR